MFEIFIRRPILSGVISVVIVFLGLLAITSLPIPQFPDIVPPSVTVTARYTGANADVMAKTVATPLERAINGVPGMTYMTTVCTNDGMSLTTIYFKVGTDPDVASVNVQNRVTTVLDELPEECDYRERGKQYVDVSEHHEHGQFAYREVCVQFCRYQYPA